jgi:hypothetical protein
MGKKRKEFVWDVYGAVVGSKYLGVFTAATSEEAVQKALRSEEASISLCHECSREISDPMIDEKYTTASKRDEAAGCEDGE